jgi:hypothetical protein
MSYVVEVYQKHGNVYYENPVYKIETSNLTSAKKACITYSNQISGYFYRITGDKTDLWFIAKKVISFGRSPKKELVEVTPPIGRSDRLNVMNDEMNLLKKEIEALRARVSSDKETIASQAAEISKLNSASANNGSGNYNRSGNQCNGYSGSIYSNPSNDTWHSDRTRPSYMPGGDPRLYHSDGRIRDGYDP